MLPRENRLVSKYSFSRLYKRGKVYFSPFFSLTVGTSKNQEDLKIGFVVSTKIDKRATVRNNLKRKLREAVRIILPTLKRGFEASFYVKNGMKGKRYEEVSAEVNKVLQKTPLL